MMSVLVPTVKTQPGAHFPPWITHKAGTFLWILELQIEATSQSRAGFSLFLFLQTVEFWENYTMLKITSWTSEPIQEKALVFSGILYGEPRSQQSLHQISLKIFKLVSQKDSLEF